MAKKFKFNVYLNAKYNTDNAVKIANTTWSGFSDFDKDTWKTSSPFNIFKMVRDNTGMMHFFSIVMKKFSDKNNNLAKFSNIKLKNAQGNSYSKRKSWSWECS